MVINNVINNANGNVFKWEAVGFNNGTMFVNNGEMPTKKQYSSKNTRVDIFKKQRKVLEGHKSNKTDEDSTKKQHSPKIDHSRYLQGAV